MNIPKYARYDYCAQKACEFLEEYKIKSFPIDPFEIIQTEKYGLMKYSELMEEYNCSLDKITSTLTIQEYKVLENEANAFARNVLSPVPMFLTLKDKSINNVSLAFGISPSAAEARIDFLNTDAEIIRGLNLTQRIMLVYHRFMNKRKCTTCNTQFFHKYIYCPICGSKNALEWGDGDKMKYPLLETYENGKLKECPNCKKEETDIEGDFCQICGKNLINRCINNECGNSEILLSNARYCSICGGESSFYHDNL